MVSQIVTISAVLVGAIATYLTTYLLTRQRNQHELSTRWDGKKLDAYENYVDKVRASVSAALTLYEACRQDDAHGRSPGPELREGLAESVRVRSRAFERVMLLGGDDVVEAAHELNAVVEGLIWRSRGDVVCAHSEWMQHFGSAFQAINAFHDAARADLGVRGRTRGEGRPERGVLMPPRPAEPDRGPS